MNSFPEAPRGKTSSRSSLRLVLPLVTIALVLSSLCQTEAAPNIVLWDTGSRLGETLDLDSREEWKPVPSDLFALEANPPKASSDPGYYGREYVFKGDAVVENNSLTAVFWSAKGRVTLYPKINAASGAKTFGQILAEITPLEPLSQTIDHCSIVRNASDEVVLEVFFSGPESQPALFSFGKTEIVEIKPPAKTKGTICVVRIA